MKDKKQRLTILIDEIYPGFIGIQEFTISPYKDGTGIYEGDLKIIRNSAIGFFAWDSSTSDVNKGNGINQWGGSVAANHEVRPVVFLNANVKISGGDRTPTNPYTLSLN